MAKVIYKYPITSGPVEMPKDAKVLAVQAQAGQVVAWAEADHNAPIEKRQFVIYGTGHVILEVPQTYVGTVQLDQFVWHVYERLKEK